MTTRLFTFGCSFSRWLWPTWADLLATEFDEFQNYGINGVGNKCIAERVSECLLLNDLTSHDTVIVQWTDYHRFDFHRLDLLDSSNWACSGNIHLNPHLPTEISGMWSEYSYIMHTWNFINLTASLLKNSKCRWYFTSSVDISSDLEKFPTLSRYKKILELKNWLPTIDSVVDRNTYQGIKMPKGWFNSKTQIQDIHPTTAHYRLWLAKYLQPITKYQDYDTAFNKIQDQQLEYSDIDWSALNIKNSWDQFNNYKIGL